MPTIAWGGDPDNTNGWISDNGNFVFTDGIAMPTARLDSTGGRPIYVGSIGTDYLLNGYTAINYLGNVIGGNIHFGQSGGVFRHMCVKNAGDRMYFGRNTANGAATMDAQGGSWGGGLCGYMNWAQVATAPSMVSAVPIGPGRMRVTFTGNGVDNGGSAITGWWLQYSRNSNFSAATTINSDGSTDISGLIPGVRYYFRAATRNGVSDIYGRASQFSGAISAVAIGGGRRHNGTSFVPLSIGRIAKSPTNFDELVIRRRFNGVSWVNITN